MKLQTNHKVKEFRRNKAFRWKSTHQKQVKNALAIIQLSSTFIHFGKKVRKNV